ncbi:cation transporter [Sphingomonas gilva]|uniref:Cation transporter n=1 Tax=Sphingomonas gilva TaxID=2305907 RepID=A0A396RPK9_9SPHN|nr:CDF family Co(II)/Ni(II) efflux transporter DmeF [Sphingomonas gilva]RHW18319.1 cation transporter [Sphingomonas gilva]
MNDIPGCHDERHAYLGAAHDANARRTLWVVALTAVMMVVEIVAGWWTGSMALLADGFHMATHAGALGVAALAYRYARAHANDPRYTFGTGKVGDLAGFASALVLAVFALGIGWESVERLIEPRGVAFGEATLVAVIGLVVNLASAWLLGGGGHHHHHGHDHGHGHAHHHGADNNLRAAYFHVLADALTSVLAIVALLAGAYLGWGWADAVVGILGAIVIARWAWGLMRDSASVLLDTADPDVAQAMRSAIEGAGDAELVDLHVWKIGPAARAAIVTVSGPASAEAVRVRLAGVPGLAHVTVERR